MLIALTTMLPTGIHLTGVMLSRLPRTTCSNVAKDISHLLHQKLSMTRSPPPFLIRLVISLSGLEPTILLLKGITSGLMDQMLVTGFIGMTVLLLGLRTMASVPALSIAVMDSTRLNVTILLHLSSNTSAPMVSILASSVAKASFSSCFLDWFE